MVEAVANLAQIEVEVFAWHAAVRVQPVLGVAPEALDAVDVVTSDWPALLLADDDMVAAQLQRGVGLPLIGVVQRALTRVGIDLLRPGLGLAVAAGARAAACRGAAGVELLV